MLSLGCCVHFSAIVASGGFLLVSVRGLLLEVASLIAERKL